MSYHFRYVGCFVDPDVLHEKLTPLSRTPLSTPILMPHVTVSYRPAAVDQSLFGIPVRIRIVGYGRDENNEGLLVELSTQEPRLEKLLQTVEIPHITLSISQSGKAVNTRRLHFTAVDPIELPSVYGGCAEDHTIILFPSS